MSEITPENINDPEIKAEMRARARNTANVNPSPTTAVPVKSQAVAGPTETAEAKQLLDADAAVVDPSPELNADDPTADAETTASKKPSKPSGTDKK